ncbi:MAG: hypothetical protein V1670_03235 [Candidatus Omnitrophota bacterium]
MAIGLPQNDESRVLQKSLKIKQPRFALFLRWLSICIIILTILRLPIKFNRIWENIENETADEERAVIKIMSKYKRSTRWVSTNRPVFAFYADMLVPPELAVFSRKRMLSGNLQPNYIINMLAKYKPELILLGRFQDRDLKILPFIERNYSKIYYYKKEPYSKFFSIKLPYPRDKNPLIKSRFFSDVLRRYKLKPIKNKNIRRYKRSKHNNPELTLYLRKDMPNSN